MPLSKLLGPNSSTVIGCVALLGLLGLPTWIPLIRGKSDPFTMYRLALVVTALAQAVQVYFIVRTGIFIPAARSYAVVGLPLGMIGAGLAATSAVTNWRAVGCLITALFTCMLWLIFVMFH